MERTEVSVNRAIKELNISKATFYNWYNKFLEGGPDVLEAQKSRVTWNKMPVWVTLFNTGDNPNEVEVCNISIGIADTKKLSNNFIKLFFIHVKKHFLKSRLMNFFKYLIFFFS